MNNPVLVVKKSFTHLFRWGGKIAVLRQVNLEVNSG